MKSKAYWWCVIFLLSRWPVNLNDFIQMRLDSPMVTWWTLKHNWRHLIEWWLVLQSEKGEHVTKDQFHLITLCFIQPDISHDVLCTEVKSAGWQYIALMYCFSNLGPVHCPISCSNCYLLTLIQGLHEAGQVAWYSHLFKSFP